MTGHPIKSRRGGIRWHRSHTQNDRQRAFSRAATFYNNVDIEIPENVKQFLIEVK